MVTAKKKIRVATLFVRYPGTPGVSAARAAVLLADCWPLGVPCNITLRILLSGSVAKYGDVQCEKQAANECRHQYAPSAYPPPSARVPFLGTRYLRKYGQRGGQPNQRSRNADHMRYPQGDVPPPWSTILRLLADMMRHKLCKEDDRTRRDHTGVKVHWIRRLG
jgi:hypothetical protein